MRNDYGLDPGIDGILEELRKTRRQTDALPRFRWAVVTQTNPLRIRLEEDSVPLLGTPSTLVSGLAVGDRVRVEIQNNRVVVHGKGGGEIDTGWQTLPRSSGISIHSSQTPQWRRKNDKFYMRGAVTPSSGSFTTSYREIVPAGGVPNFSGLRNGWTSVRVVPSGGGAPPGRMYTQGDGSVMVATTEGTAPYYMLNSEYLIEE